MGIKLKRIKEDLKSKKLDMDDVLWLIDCFEKYEMALKKAKDLGSKNECHTCFLWKALSEENE